MTFDAKLQDRIIGALTFRQGVYDDVENDPSFTQTAWIIVIVAQFLSNLGSYRSNIVGAIIGTIIGVALFYLMVQVVNWVARQVFKATVTPDELVRALGLASIWNIVGILGFIPVLGGLIGFIAAILWFAAGLLATKACLDLDWTQTIVTLVIAFLIYFVAFIIVTTILVALGIGAAAVGGAFR